MTVVTYLWITIAKRPLSQLLLLWWTRNRGMEETWSARHSSCFPNICTHPPGSPASPLPGWSPGLRQCFGDVSQPRAGAMGWALRCSYATFNCTLVFNHCGATGAAQALALLLELCCGAGKAAQWYPVQSSHRARRALEAAWRKLVYVNSTISNPKPPKKWKLSSGS